MLIYFNDDEYAEQLQNCMEQFMLLIKSSKSEIWDKFAPSQLDRDGTELTFPIVDLAERRIFELRRVIYATKKFYIDLVHD